MYEELLVIPRADALRIPPRGAATQERLRPRGTALLEPDGASKTGLVAMLTASCVDSEIRLLVIDHPSSSNEKIPPRPGRGRVVGRLEPRLEDGASRAGLR